ncbi:MAG: nucleotide exchange factor GrpE [Pseudolabrys sp.]
MTDHSADDDMVVTQPVEAAQSAPAGEMVPAGQVVAALEAAADFKDKLLRTLADMENLRKRTEREVADARSYSITGFARDVLAVADNMHRALEALGPEERNATDDAIKALIEGLDLTDRELHKVLDKHGVKKFTPLGEKFDPNLHQAMYESTDGSAAPGTVAQVIQSGYMIGERMLRPALVAVAKAPKAEPANDNSGSLPDSDQ